MFFQKMRKRRQMKEAERKLTFDKIRDAEEKMTLFAEGKMSTYEFWELYQKDENIRNTLINDPKLPKKIKHNPFLYNNLDINMLHYRCELYRVVKVYFLRRNINLNFYNKDSEKYTELLDIAPRYVDIDSMWFNDNVLQKCEYNLGTKERKEWLRNKIREVFRYDNKPPRWLQNPEWPIGENGPLLFKKQSAHPNFLTDDYIDYYFDDAGKEVVVRQYD